MSNTYPNKPFEYFYHGEQVYTYLVQFMAIFSGIQVSVGKNKFNDESSLIYVPIRYGSTDKTVEWVISSQTTNKPIRVPIMAVKISGIEFAPELRKGMRTESARVSLPLGASLPDGLKTIRQKQPNPCKLNLELSVFTSNLKNRFEILEQILLLFEPDIQIFTSDDYDDHYKIGRVELLNMTFDEDYPMGQGSNQLIVDTYQFYADVALRTPVDLKESYVKSIKLRLDSTSNLPANEAVIELNNIGNTGTILFDIDDLDIPEN